MSKLHTHGHLKIRKNQQGIAHYKDIFNHEQGRLFWEVVGGLEKGRLGEITRKVTS